MDKRKLQDMIEPVLNDMDIRLIELEWLQQKDPVLQISVLKQDGTMDLDTCADVSERISALLDEKDPIDCEYTLEVCSPGAEREIKDYAELDQVQNPYVYVRLKAPVKKSIEYTGDVLANEEDHIVLEYRDKAARRRLEIEKDNIAFIRFAVRI